MNILQTRGLEVAYGGIRAVKGVDLTVRRGELVCSDRRQRRRQDHDAQVAVRHVVTDSG